MSAPTQVRSYHYHSDQRQTLLGGLMTSATMKEKRRVFLRSYQFSRKMSHSDKIKRSVVRVKRLIWIKLRSARRYRRVVCSKLRRFSLLSSAANCLC